jgi:hypothetical protein
VLEAARITAELTHIPLIEQSDLSDLPELLEGIVKERIISARLNQRFFREALLSSYNRIAHVA